MERATQVHDPADAAPDPGPEAPADETLTLVGTSDDGATLLLLDEDGRRHVLPVTATLRAALRVPAPRPGPKETTMDSVLRPRDIQARIRSGETAEAVAEAAQTSVEKIMPFVAPVLAEREHVAERARSANLRRPAGESGTGARALGDAVEAHVRSLNLDPDAVTWDAWRREDGRWTLTGTYAFAARTGTAHLTYDARGSYVVLDDEDARWLVGDAVATPPELRDDLQQARERRLAPVPHDPLGDDAIELVSDPPADEPLEAFLDDSPGSDDAALREQAADAAAEDADPELPLAEPDPEPEPQPEPPARRPVQKKKGRASVPSWDEIMFGGPSSD